MQHVSVLRTVRTCTLAALLLCLGVSVSTGREQPIVGTTDDELKQLALPQPNACEVAILPFHAVTLQPSHVAYCRDALVAHFAGEGFRVTHPALVFSLAAEAAARTQPGQPLQPDEIAAIGRRAGARWAVYGTINECEDFKSNSMLWGTQRKCRVAMQLNIADLETGKVIFWQQRTDKTGGGIGSNSPLFGRKRAGLERQGLAVCSGNILKRLFGALPTHDKPKFTLDSLPCLDAGDAAAAYAKNPTDWPTCLTQAQALLCDGKGGEAVQLLAPLAGSRGNDAEAHFWYGTALYSTAAREQAIAEWRAALVADPNHKLAQQLLSGCG